MDLTALRRTGAEYVPGLVRGSDLELLEALVAEVRDGAAGDRLSGSDNLNRLLRPDGPVHALALKALGSGARPVRAVLFDKTPTMNWAVAWHQDRTIAVRERVEVDGFGPWSRKAGKLHVEPPFRIIEEMVTLRVHLDPCPPDNAPLMVATGSHRLGRVPADKTADWAARLEILTCLAEPGDVWVYATPILHASERSRSGGRRRVLQVDYAAAALPGGLEWAGVA